MQTDNDAEKPQPASQLRSYIREGIAAPDIRSPILLLIFLILTIAGVGFFVFNRLQQNETQVIEQNLAAIANLKADQINGWIRQNKTNVLVTAKNSALADRTAEWLEQGALPDRNEKWLHDRIELVREQYSFRVMALLDLNGAPRLSTDTVLPDVSGMLPLLQHAINQKQPVLGELRWNARPDGARYVSLPIAAPLITSGAGNSVVGILLVDLDASQFLFPLIQTWPAPSTTAETQMVRRDGDDVLFLNELRSQKDTALRLRIPADEPTRLAAQAARGATGFIRGTDYRGEPGIGYALKIPDTDWIIVAKIDSDEVYAPVRQIAFAVMVTTLVLLSISSLVLFFWWRNRNAQYRAAQLQSELRRQLLTQQFDYLTRYANDIILLLDEGGNIVEVNERAETAYGLSRRELLGRNIRELHASADRENFDQHWNEIKRNKSLLYEGSYIRNDGTKYQAEVKTRLIETEKGQFVQKIIRDITERKKAEKERLQTLQQLEAVLENIREGVVISDLDGNLLSMNQAALQMQGFHDLEHARRQLKDYEHEFKLFDSEDHALPRSEWPLPRVLRGETINNMEVRIENGETGHPRIIAYSGVQIINDASAVYLGVLTLRDITEQKRAEEELKLAGTVFQSSSEAILVTNAENRIVAVNPAFEEITGYAAEEAIGKNPSILKSGRHDDAFYRDMWQALDATGSWKGELWNRSKNGELIAVLTAINTNYNSDGSVHRRVALISDITEKKKSEELVWQQANFDALTGLPNRRMFQDHLQRELRKAARSSQPLALMFMDLDGFKDVNDMLGHDMGDLLLKETAQRLLGCVRDTDTVARLGGDEFTIILSDLRDSGNVGTVAEHILHVLSEPFKLNNEVAHVSASIGITLYPQDATGMDELLINADQAMYAAKQAGKNRYSYFTDFMQQAAQERMWLVNELRNAIAGKQFSLVYQPIVDLSSGCINKAEALIRWHHPERGLIDPSVFIPVAEETGMIQEIGDWVFSEAANQAVKWRKTHHPDFQISINKSPVQFKSSESDVPRWLSQLEELDLPGQSITVEITEGILMDANTGVAKQLLAYRDAGIEVALDDFGTGYSSLSYLKKFDIDRLKIDRTFVRDLETDPNDLALCEAIIVMAHKLNIKVIAEGVETKAQRDLLQNAGCDFVQGYLFSDPLSAQELEGILKKGAVYCPVPNSEK